MHSPVISFSSFIFFLPCLELFLLWVLPLDLISNQGPSISPEAFDFPRTERSRNCKIIIIIIKIECRRVDREISGSDWHRGCVRSLCGTVRSLAKDTAYPIIFTFFGGVLKARTARKKQEKSRKVSWDLHIFNSSKALKNALFFSPDFFSSTKL